MEPEYLKGRPKIKNELENEMNLKPFNTINLMNAQIGSNNKYRCQVGKVKGLWTLTDTPKIPFGKNLATLLEIRTVCVRLYVLNGIRLAPVDGTNSADPYLTVKLGKNVSCTRSRYMANTLQPKFHESFEFFTYIPGPTQLTIEVWSRNGSVNSSKNGIYDDLIGCTTIDIEDRWFSRNWRKLIVKPIEERKLYNPRTTTAFGKLRLWLDMFDMERHKCVTSSPLVDISLAPKIAWEMRLIIWKAKDVLIKNDEIFGKKYPNNLSVKCKLMIDNETQIQSTDIHWRSKYGKPRWNWRMKFNVFLPFDKNHTRLNLTMLDYLRNVAVDQGTSDVDVDDDYNYVGELNIDLDLLLMKCYSDYKLHGLQRLTLKHNGSKKFWMNVLNSKYPQQIQAKLQISIELMTGDVALRYPCGFGRGQPNNNPYLPKPRGRIKYPSNPLQMLIRMFGSHRQMYYGCISIFCVTIIILVMIFVAPQLLVTFLSQSIVDSYSNIQQE